GISQQEPRAGVSRRRRTLGQRRIHSRNVRPLCPLAFEASDPQEIAQDAPGLIPADPASPGAFPGGPRELRELLTSLSRCTRSTSRHLPAPPMTVRRSE